MTEWEYKTYLIAHDDEKALRNTVALNRLGKQGWELAAAVPAYAGSHTRLYFKRPKA